MRNTFYPLRLSPAPGIGTLTDTSSLSWLSEARAHYLPGTRASHALRAREKGRSSSQRAVACYHALEAWARGSGFSAQSSHTGNTKYLHLLCSQAPAMLWGMGGFQVFSWLLSFQPPAPREAEALLVLHPGPSGLPQILWVCRKPHWSQHLGRER